MMSPLFEFEDNLPLFNTTLDFAKKQASLRVVVGITCSLSIIGSILIILSYLLLRDMRTNARLILVHLSLADLGVGFANLFGDLVRFDKYYNYKNMNSSELDKLDSLCKAQAILAHFSTISSVLWTMMLALFMYTVITKLNMLEVRSNRIFMVFACLFSYGTATFITVWMLLTHRLGFSPHDTSGWCGIIVNKLPHHPSHHHHHHHHQKDYISATFGYDLWIVLTSVVIIVVYTSLHCYVKQERTKSSDFNELIKQVDYKFILIPVVFILLRMWSFIENLLFVYIGLHGMYRNEPLHGVHKILSYLAGIGDSGQGAVNAVLFVVFTRNIRIRFFRLFCRCFKRNDQIKSERRKLTDKSSLSDEEDNNESINTCGGFVTPVHISSKKRHYKRDNFHDYDSLASTSLSLSEASLTD